MWIRVNWRTTPKTGNEIRHFRQPPSGQPKMWRSSLACSWTWLMKTNFDRVMLTRSGQQTSSCWRRSLACQDSGLLTFRTISFTFGGSVWTYYYRRRIIIVAWTLLLYCGNSYVNIICPVSEYSVNLHLAFHWHDIAWRPAEVHPCHRRTASVSWFVGEQNYSVGWHFHQFEEFNCGCFFHCMYHTFEWLYMCKTCLKFTYTSKTSPRLMHSFHFYFHLFVFMFWPLPPITLHTNNVNIIM